MSPRAWINSLIYGALCWLIIFAVVAGFRAASRGDLPVLHLQAQR